MAYGKTLSTVINVKKNLLKHHRRVQNQVDLKKLIEVHAMTNAIVNKLKKFRTDLFAFFTYRADSTMDLIDAIAGQSSKESTVKISLSTLFRRTYCVFLLMIVHIAM